MKEAIIQILAMVGGVGILAILWLLVTGIIDWFKRRELNRQMLTDSRNDHHNRIMDLETEVRSLKLNEKIRCENENKKD